MKKGKFGIVLCFYPILAFFCVIVKLPLAWLPMVLAIFVEQDEWAGRQTIQAFLLSAFTALFGSVVPGIAERIDIPFLSEVLFIVVTILSFAAYLIAVILSILGILKVLKDQEADLPLLADLAMRAYGKRKAKPAPTTYYSQQAPQQPPFQPAPFQQTNSNYSAPGQQRPLQPAQPPVQQTYTPPQAPQNENQGPSGGSGSAI